jgi:hypothetical protein
MDSSSQGGRRGHFHRGRRGPDRRGSERRSSSQSSEQAPHEQARRGDHVDVEQIMRDIRARIGQRPAIELTDPQVQELAARRLEAILDPRSMRPGLLDQLRRSAGVPAVTTPHVTTNDPPYRFEDTTLYESHNPITRAIRKLLNPLLKLFFNPNPLIQALNIQSRLNVEAAQREAERVQQQAEWNALHYEILQRLVTEVSRVSLEMQAMSLKVDSFGAKVDFNERRVRGIEGALHQGRMPGGREIVPQASTGAEAPPDAPASEAASPGETPSGEGHQRRRRRRRRGRRGAGPPEAISAASRAMPAGEAPEPEEVDDGREDASEALMTVTTDSEPIATTERASPDRHEQPPPPAAPPAEPDRAGAVPSVTPQAAERPREPGPDDQ